ncbi:tRNA-specific adenosine deaminase 1 [Panulirus ornatus]|uniref:tRNA-specific adenosine deaminase 1 n=1 Tax=Panulirus ornatus TaxID=150431 RepID=UPI003A888839
MMDRFGGNFADEVAKTSISKYESLGKTGKPKKDTEWTPLACFLKMEHDTNILEVVALGTGSKCLGANYLPSNGVALHDSHAEVIARRAFMLYLLNQIEKALQGEVSIFIQKDDKFLLKSEISFHFYASHTPCGDASIFPKQKWLECYGEIVEASFGEESFQGIKKHHREGNAPTYYNEHCSDANVEQPLKKIKMEKVNLDVCITRRALNLDDDINTSNSIKESEGTPENNSSNVFSHNVKGTHEEDCTDHDLIKKVSIRPDIYRTGAKCVIGEKADPKMPGHNYHVTGALRIKPGRGDRTLSLSCSDKIFKWTVLGVQGALLMLFLETPVYIKTITIGHCPYSQEAMERALFGRFEDKVKDLQLPVGFQLVKPLIFHSDIDFPFSRGFISSHTSEISKVMPSPTSLIWSSSDIHKDKHEVSAKGYKLGTTKINQGTRQSWVSICRQAILQRMLMLYVETGKITHGGKALSYLSYGQMKCQSHSYQKAWDSLKTNVLINWTVKPHSTKRIISVDMVW